MPPTAVALVIVAGAGLKGVAVRRGLAYHRRTCHLRPFPPMKHALRLCLFAGFLFVLSAAGARDWNAIRIGIDATYKPFTYKTPDGKPAVFDVDIAAALCARMQARCSFVESTWESIIPGLVASQKKRPRSARPLQRRTQGDSRRRHVPEDRRQVFRFRRVWEVTSGVGR